MRSSYLQPSPFPAETRESALRKIEEEYLTPCLDEAASDVTLCGKQWDFDWFGEGVYNIVD